MKINYNCGRYDNCVFVKGYYATDCRQELMSKLHSRVPYFDPVTPETTLKETIIAENCENAAKIDVLVLANDDLYIFDDFAIFEWARKMPEKKIFAIVGEISAEQKERSKELKERVTEIGCRVYSSTDEVAAVINATY